METFEIKDLEIEEKVEYFDETSLLDKALSKSKSYDYLGEEVLFVVVKTKCGENSFQSKVQSLNLCGKSPQEWVLLAGSGLESKVIEDEDVLSKLREIETDKKVIAVFYSDTPLLDRNLLCKICDYFYSRNMNYLALSRGFVVKKEFLTNNDSFLQGKNVFEDEGLIRLNSTQSLEYVFKKLSDRIREYHIHNGVIILGKDSVYIDADVEIGNGTIIYPNNTILGNSIIEDNVCLESGNYIKNSIICKDTTLSNCRIIKSKISKNIENKTIEGEEI